MKYTIFLLVCALFSGCNKQAASGPESSGYSAAAASYKEKAYEIMGIPQVEFEKNETNEYVLATYKSEENVPNSKPLQYAVLKISDNSLIKKGVLPQGSIRWVDSYILEIIAPPGIPEGDKTIKDYTAKYDVKSGKSISPVQVKN